MNNTIEAIVDELIKYASKARFGRENLSEKSDRDCTIARREILEFLLYLSASDGSISEAESEFLKKYLEEEYSPQQMCQLIESRDLYSTRFEQRIPSTLRKLINLDNKLFARDDDLRESLGERYICAYEALGKEFIACDREVSQAERDDLDTYIKNMRSYYRANYKGPEEATKISHREHAVIESSRNQKSRNAVEEANGEESLEELMNQLNALIGLDKVKSTVHQLIHFNSIRNIRDERDLPQMPITQHMVFYGNPGTGKTTVARLIAKIYHRLGLLSKGHMVEVDRSGLVAGYVGHTALKVKDVIKQAKGGVLFIDEAYALTYKRHEHDFGFEAVDTLVKALEDEREDLVVIVAGYTEPMTEFINSNIGLKSRFNRFIEFTDYSGEELLEIYNKMTSEYGYETAEDALEYIEDYLEEKALFKCDDRDHSSFGMPIKKRNVMMEGSENFANARLVRNLIETAIMNQADRLYGNEPLSDEELNCIEYEDVKTIA